jgi:hypothetical protein
VTTDRHPVRFVLVLQPLPGVADPIKALRWILKKAGRLGLKCIDVHEEKELVTEK